MPKLIKTPTIIQAAGNKPKIIQEYFGRVNTRSSDLSVAWMKSPAGWVEPGQKPEFDEYTVVIKGALNVRSENGVLEVKEGQAVLAAKGEWVQYSTPLGAEYIAICYPAFSPDSVHRDPA